MVTQNIKQVTKQKNLKLSTSLRLQFNSDGVILIFPGCIVLFFKRTSTISVSFSEFVLTGFAIVSYLEFWIRNFTNTLLLKKNIIILQPTSKTEITLQMQINLQWNLTVKVLSLFKYSNPLYYLLCCWSHTGFYMVDGRKGKILCSLHIFSKTDVANVVFTGLECSNSRLLHFRIKE